MKKFVFSLAVLCCAVTMSAQVSDEMNPLITSMPSLSIAPDARAAGLGDVGPVGNYAMFTPLTKCVLMFDMLAGRLELFPLLLLFIPAAWKKS